jgi:hypothetical protein
VLDRRIDPERQLEYTANNEAFEATLKGIALRLKLGVSLYGAVVYFGPEETARKLRTLALVRQADLAALPSPVRKKWATSKAVHWTDGAESRAVLAGMCQELGLTVTNLEQLPHDLLAEQNWAALSGAERLTLFAAQFGLTWKISPDGKQLTLEPIPENVEYSQDYAWKNPLDLCAKLKQLQVRAEPVTGENKVRVTGLAEEHQLAVDLISGKTAKTITVSEGEKRYSLKVHLEVGKLIRNLAPKLGLEAEFAEEEIKQAGLSLEQEVQVSVQDATTEELLTAVLQPAGLTHKIQDRTLKIVPLERGK